MSLALRRRVWRFEGGGGLGFGRGIEGLEGLFVLSVPYPGLL